MGTGLSAKGKKIICCYIADELEIFEELMRRAMNLSPQEKEEGLASTYDDCQVSSRNHPDTTRFPWKAWVQNSELSGCPEGTLKGD